MSKLFRITGFAAFAGMIFLNAFVDLGHKIIIQNTVFKTWDGQTQVILTAIVNALILLPFILLFTPAGFTADKYPKHTVMRASAWAAVALTLLITACYYAGWFWPAFGMTFLLAVQSAFYSPAKYGYIRELTGTENLASANGIVQATTTVAILAGVFAFSVLFEGYLDGAAALSQGALLQRIAPVGWALVAGSLAELVLAYRLPQTQGLDASLEFDRSRYLRAGYLRSNIGLLRSKDVIFLSIVGLSVFWAIGQVMLAAFPAYAKAELGIGNTVLVQGLLASSGIGIVIGSIIAGRLSRNHIETGFIPIGAFGVALSLLLTPLFDAGLALMLNFIAFGVLGGLFIIPLNALIQYHAAEDERGRVLAGNNFVQNVVMLGFLGLTVLFAVQGLSSRNLIHLLVVVAFAGAVYTVYKLPQALARIIASLLMAQRYRLTILGFEHLPATGGVLLLGNHISWLDWALVQIACPRPVRFVMARAIYERWYLKWFLDFFGVIPVGGAGSRKALDAVREHLNNGEVVCLFPEGTISRTGHLAEFKRGFETAAEGAGGVIIPFYLRGLWGSTFSRASSRMRLLRRGGLRRDIIIAFGPALPMTTQADTLKRRLLDLSVESWHRHADTLPSLPAAWLATSRRVGSDLAVADTTSGALSGNRFAAGVMLFADRVGRLCPEQNVGLLMPTTAAGAIANMAVLMRGKTIVNLNYTASAAAIAAAVRKAGLRHVITSERFLKRLERRGIVLDEALAGVELIIMEKLGAQITPLRRLLALLEVILLPAPLLHRLHGRPVPVDSPAAILFSSGSEGEPKGVVLSHRNIMANLKQISDVLNTEDDDVIMATLPLFHAFGLTVTTFMPLVEGIPVVCHPDPTDAPNIAKAIATWRATLLCGTSTFLRLYEKNRRVHPLMLASLRLVVAGAEKLAPEVRERFKLRFGVDIYEGYGATETTPVASVNIPDRLDPTWWHVQVGNKPGTVGMPLPGTSCRIVDPDTLAELPVGEDGLILIGGVQVMLGYLDDPARTAEAIVELDGTRWYRTGDKGHLDEDGFLSIVDRYSRFAKLGGEMVSLSAVEAAVRDTLADAELELVAVNLPDPKKGEQVVLLVGDPARDPQGLRKALTASDMNPLMVPAAVFCIAEVPMLGSGKTDFKAARARAEALVGGA